MDNLDFNYFCSKCNKDLSYRKENCFTRYRIKHYKQGEHISYRGSEATELTLLIKGSVSTVIVLDTGVCFTSRTHFAPYPLGALAIFANDNYYRADCIALEDCTAITIKKDMLEEQMSRCVIFLRSFIAYNTSKIDVFTKHITVLTHKNLKSKLAFYILLNSKDGNFVFDRKLESLATYLCVERPSLSRAISQMVSQNIITYERGKGKILDIRVLNSMIESV